MKSEHWRVTLIQEGRSGKQYEYLLAPLVETDGKPTETSAYVRGREVVGSASGKVLTIPWASIVLIEHEEEGDR